MAKTNVNQFIGPPVLGPTITPYYPPEALISNRNKLSPVHALDVKQPVTQKPVQKSVQKSQVPAQAQTPNTNDVISAFNNPSVQLSNTGQHIVQKQGKNDISVTPAQDFLGGSVSSDTLNPSNPVQGPPENKSFLQHIRDAVSNPSFSRVTGGLAMAMAQPGSPAYTAGALGQQLARNKSTDYMLQELASGKSLTEMDKSQLGGLSPQEQLQVISSVNQEAAKQFMAQRAQHGEPFTLSPGQTHYDPANGTVTVNEKQYTMSDLLSGSVKLDNALLPAEKEISDNAWKAAQNEFPNSIVWDAVNGYTVKGTDKGGDANRVWRDNVVRGLAARAKQTGNRSVMLPAIMASTGPKMPPVRIDAKGDPIFFNIFHDFKSMSDTEIKNIDPVLLQQLKDNNLRESTVWNNSLGEQIVYKDNKWVSVTNPKE